MIRWSMWLLTNIEVIIFTSSDNVRHMWIISLNYTISFVKFGFEGQTGVPRLISSTLGFTVSTDSSYPTVFAAGHIGLIHAVVVVRPQWAFGGFNPTGFWVHLRLICRFHAQSSVSLQALTFSVETFGIIPNTATWIWAARRWAEHGSLFLPRISLVHCDPKDWVKTTISSNANGLLPFGHVAQAMLEEWHTIPGCCAACARFLDQGTAPQWPCTLPCG